MTDKSIAHDCPFRNADDLAGRLDDVLAHHDSDVNSDERGPVDDACHLRIIDTKVPPLAMFAGSLTGLKAFSMALRALERLDSAPDGPQPVVVDLRAVVEADSSNLSSIAVWVLHRISQQRGPIRLLLPPNEVGDAMLHRLPAKPSSVQQDDVQGCLVVDIGD